MKIAAYNLRAGGRRGGRVHWQRLLDQFAPEILLMQETQHPAGYLPPAFYEANAQRIHWLPAPGRKWGSAIYVRSGRLKPLTLPCYPGCVVAAEVTGSAWSRRTGRPLRLASLHVPAPYKRPMHAILDFFATLGTTHDWILAAISTWPSACATPASRSPPTRPGCCTACAANST